MSLRCFLLISALVPALLPAQATGPDQTKVGVGNAAANTLAGDSGLAQSSYQFLLRQTNMIQDPTIRLQTQDALRNASTCIQSRAGLTSDMKQSILKQLMDQGLANAADAGSINGGALAGVFPPVVNDGTGCPNLPMRWYAAPGSAYGGHHSYPGGLPIHETCRRVHRRRRS